MAKQDVTVELFYSGQWNDHTDDVYARDDITINRGRGAESEQTPPATATLTFDNRDGTFNPRNPNSSLYGLIGRNTPLRIGMTEAATVTDTFTRSVTDGWGNTDTGDTWTLTGTAANFDVNGSAGTITGGASGQFATLGTYGDVEVLCRISSTDLDREAGIVGRFTDSSNYYSLEIKFDTGTGGQELNIWNIDGGSPTNLATASGAFTSGTFYWVKVRMVGNSLRMKVWEDGTTEPSTWDLEVEDSTHTSGAVGVGAWNTTGNKTFDDFQVSPASDRFTGEVSSWTPQRAVKGNAWTEVVASGPSRRLGQGSEPLQSAMRRYIPLDHGFGAPPPVGYWPLDGGELSTFGRAVIGSDMKSSSGAVQWGSADLAPWLEPGVSFVENATLRAPVSMAETQDSILFTFQYRADGAGPSGAFVITLPGNTEAGGTEFIATFTPPSTVALVVNQDGSLLDSDSVTDTRLFDGGLHHIQLQANNVGGTINAGLFLMKLGNPSTDTILFLNTPAATLSGTSQVRISYNPGSAAVPLVVGHVAIWDEDGNAAALALHEPALGFTGETADARFTRLCEEEGITASIVGTVDDSQPMGPQHLDTLASLLREIEATDDGFLFDDKDARGLVFRTGRSRYNQNPALELDFDQAQVAPPLEPIVDDRDVRNDVTATRRAGSSARAVQETGPLNVQDPTDDADGVGRYSTQIQVNPQSDLDLGNHAGWHLHLGTVDETRYPRISVDLDASPSLATDASAVDIGDRITITNLEVDLVSLIVQGYTEVIGSHRRKITFNTSPESPAHIAEVEHADFDVIGSDSAVTAEALDTTETGVNINCGAGPDWDHESNFDVLIGGERMTVTAVAAMAGTFPNRTTTLTVTRSVNSVVKSHATGARIDFFHKSYIGL